MATQQEHPRRKLWQSLSDQGKYTKTYEEFHQQFSSPEKIEALYTALNTDGSYTKSYEDFDSQFFGGVGKPTGLSATGSADTPNVSEDPTQSTESPESATLTQSETSSEPSLPENIAPQIAQANQIASEYGQEGNEYQFDVPEGFEVVQGEVDENNRLLQPYMRNIETGERFNIIQPTTETTPEQAEQVRIQSGGAINPDEVTFKESIANTWRNMLDRFETIPLRQEIANGGMLQVRPEALANMTEQQRQAAFAQAEENYRSAYEELERFNAENPARPTKEIVESWNNNDASSLVAGAFNALTGFATSLALGSLSGGIPLAVDIVGDFKNDYNVEKANRLGITTRELVDRGLSEDKTPKIMAAISFAAEKVGIEGAGKLMPKSVISSVARYLSGSPVAKSIVSGVVDMGGEGFTEVLSQGLQETSKELAGRADYSGGDVYESLVKNTFNEANWENFWQGAIGKGLMSGAPAVVNSLKRKTVNNPELRNKVDQLIEVVNTIRSGEVPNPALNMVMDNLTSEVATGISQEYLSDSVLPEAEQDRIDRIEGEVLMLEDSKENLEGNETIIQAIDGQIDNAKTEIDNIRSDVSEQSELDRSGVSISGALVETNPPVVFRDGEQGVVRLDGQTVVFETGDTIRELGNVDEISDSDLSEFGLEVESPLNIEVNDDYGVVIDGSEFFNRNSNPLAAINYNEEGDIVSINLETENGRKRTIRGQRAQEIGYQYALKDFEQNATEEERQAAAAEIVVPAEPELNIEESQVAQEQVNEEVALDRPSSNRYYQGIPKNTPYMQGLIDDKGEVLIQGSLEEVEQFKKDNGIQSGKVSYVDLDINNPNSLVNKFLKNDNKKIETNETEQSNIQIPEIPLEGVEVAPVQEEAGPAEELVVGNPDEATDSVSAPVQELTAPVEEVNTPPIETEAVSNDNVADEQTPVQQEIVAPIDDIDATRMFAESTDDPVAIADEYSRTPAGEADYIEQGIADSLTKVSAASFGRIKGLDSLTAVKKRRFIDSKSTTANSIDVVAQEVSANLGIEVTEQDIVDFIDRYDGIADFEAQNLVSERQRILADRYYELTGNNLTPTRAERAAATVEAARPDSERFANSELADQGVTLDEVNAQNEFEASSAPRSTEMKGVLERVSNKLKQTGLANSINLATSAEISEATGRPGDRINGYVDSEGNVVINSETAGLDAPIHEVAHVWEQVIEKQNPEMHAKGMELIQTPEGKVYVDYVRDTQPSLEGQDLYKEALAQAIGDRGARIIESQKTSPIKEWIKKAWEYVGSLVGISGLTANQIRNLTLNEYADAVAVDLLSGKPFVRTTNGDILMESTATSTESMDNVDKFMSDFMLRMKKKNGIVFQGSVDGSLSTQDFVDLTTFFRHATDRGQINGIQDARDAAKAMGINSPAEVDMAYKLSKAMAGTEGGTGFKKSEVSPETLKTADFAKMSDTEYREVGKRLVDEGLVNPNELVADIIREPRALQPWEVTALQYHRTQIQTQIAEASELVENGDTAAVEAFEFQGITGYQGIAAKIEVINAQLFDMEIAMLATANQQSAAFRLRSLMADNDYNVVSYLAEMKAKGYVDPEVEAKMKKLGEELNVVRAKLAKKSAEADAMAEALAQGNINVEAALPVKKAPKRIRTKKSTVDAVNVVLDSLDLSSFGLPGMRFQTNNVIRFQVNPNDAVSASLTSAIAQMKQSIAEGNSSVPDAIEQAIAQVNAEVGEGNWDSVKFRSAVTNQLVQQQIPLKVKKPYVNSEGVLVIPGEYIKQLARDGNDTIDKMVASASAELGGSFSDYDIQNAISGYGRQSARTRTDLDRKIAKAKRVARLMSQIEDLIKKGERVKTARQKHDNDTQINALREEVRQREYDLEMTPEERAQLAEQKYLDQRKKYLQNYIDQIQDRIDNRDFAPANRENKYEDDAETKALRVEANRIKNEFKAEKYRHELQNKSTIDKAKALGYDIVFNSLRGLSAGADLSAIGVQGAVYAAANPARAAKLVWGTKNTTFSEVEYNNYFAELQNSPFYELARKHGLNLQLPNFYQSIQEEQWKGSLPTVVMDAIVGTAGKGVAFIRGKDPDLAAEYAKDKFNVFTLGDRNYAVVLSQIRMDLFTDFITNQINKKGLDTKLDEKEIRRIAETVNTITFSSRSFQPTGKLGKDIMSSVFFSFPKLIATWKILGAWAPLLIGPNRNTQLFYDAYGKTVIRGLGTMFMAAAIPTAIAALQKSLQDDEEEDPYFYNPNFLNAKHSDFFKLKAGDTRISFFQGIDGNVVFATRFITGEYLTTSSKGVRPLNGEGFNHSRASLFWQYVSNKFAPTTSIAVKASLGDRERQEAFGRFQESLSPMWASGIGDQYESSGSLGETSALAVMGMFGLSYNNYGGAEFAKKRGTNNKKAQDIFSKSGLSVYDPAEGGRSYFDGEEIVKVTGKTYSDEYLPAYQKFMTEAVLSSEKQLDRNVNWETKEGYVKKLKAEAYKYAEIKTSGIYAGGNYNKFSQDGTQYRLLQSQYGLKAKYIKEYLEKEAGRDRGIAKREVAQKLRADGLKGTDGYKEVLTELYLYNIANKAANEKMIRDMRRGKIKLAKQAEYYSDMEKEDFSEE